jgi:hypothetical protein
MLRAIEILGTRVASMVRKELAADAQGSQHSRKDSLHSTFGPSLWCHDAADHKLVGARIGEQKAADVDYVPIGDSRHSM